MPSDLPAKSMHRSADYRLAGSNTGFKEDTRANIRLLDAATRPAPGRSGGWLKSVFRRSVAEHRHAEPLAAMIASQRHEPREKALAADVRRESHTSAPLTARL
jgi:hypothetical protein